MRPRGEIRAAVASAFEAMPPAQGVTWRELAQHACVSYGLARQTANNMLAAGELVVVGHRRAPHACRPMRLYARPAEQQEPQRPPMTQALDALATCWASFA